MYQTHDTAEVQSRQIEPVRREVLESAPLPRGFYRGPRPRRHFVIWNGDEAWARRVGIMRYAGVASAATVAKALKQLARLRAIEIHRGLKVGVTRTCSAYRVTIEDPKFIHLCNEVSEISREQIAQERAYRQELRTKRQQESKPRPIPKGGAAPPASPVSPSLSRKRKTIYL